MTREEALISASWACENGGLSCKEIVGKIYDEFEKEKNLHSLTRNRFKEADKHIERLTKDRDYWKLSFNKQVEATRNA